MSRTRDPRTEDNAKVLNIIEASSRQRMSSVRAAVVDRVQLVPVAEDKDLWLNANAFLRFCWRHLPWCWRIVHGGGPSAGLALLAIFVLEESEGSMLGRDDERPAKSHWFVLEVMIVVLVWFGHMHVLPYMYIGCRNRYR
jgi:hypothetical protein